MTYRTAGPNLEPGSKFIDRTIVADRSGKLWVVDPRTGKISAPTVVVESERPGVRGDLVAALHSMSALYNDMGVSARHQISEPDAEAISDALFELGFRFTRVIEESQS